MMQNCDMLRLAWHAIDRFCNQAPAWPLCDSFALEMSKHLFQSASQHSFLYMLLLASLQNVPQTCAAAEYILQSPAVQDEQLSRELAMLTPDMYASAIPRMWDVWCSYIKSPCFYRLSFHAFSLDRMITTVSSNFDKSLDCFIDQLRTMPNIIEHDVLSLLFHVGTVSMAARRKDTACVIAMFRDMLRHNTQPLVNCIGNAVRKNRFLIDIWHHTYYFLYLAGIPVHHSVIPYNYGPYQSSQSLHIISADGSLSYMRQNGSKDLLVAALRHATHPNTDHSAHGVAFAKLVLEAYTNNFEVQKMLCERILYHVDDYASIEYAVAHMIPDVSCCIGQTPFFTRLAQKLVEGNVSFFLYLCTLPKCEIAVKHARRSWSIDVRAAVTHHIQWSKSARRHWLSFLLRE